MTEAADKSGIAQAPQHMRREMVQQDEHASIVQSLVRVDWLVLLAVALYALVEQDFDMIALPGGMPGAEHLKNDPRIADIVRRLHAGGHPVAAICAAPMVLAAAGVLEGRRATSYPGFLEGATGDAVVVDRNVITSRGPGTALDFALALVEALMGPAERQATESRLEREKPAAA